MSAPVQLACTFDSATRRKDKSLRLVFSTNLEITTTDYMELDKLVQQSGWVLFKSDEIQASEVPSVPADEAYGKMSDSQYQRWILKKIYEKSSTDLEWPDWYHQQEAKINNRLLDKLKEMEI